MRKMRVKSVLSVYSFTTENALLSHIYIYFEPLLFIFGYAMWIRPKKVNYKCFLSMGPMKLKYLMDKCFN